MIETGGNIFVQNGAVSVNRKRPVLSGSAPRVIYYKYERLEFESCLYEFSHDVIHECRARNEHEFCILEAER